MDHDFVPPGINAGGLRYHNDKFLACDLEDFDYPKEAIEGGLHHLPKLNRV